MGQGAGRVRARTGWLLVVVVGSVALSGCFAPAPRPAPRPVPAAVTAPPAPPVTTTTTTTTTTAPSAAHLSVQPGTLTLTAERTIFPAEDTKTVTVKNTGGTTSGPIDATTASVLVDPAHGDSGMWLFSDPDHDCLDQALAPGASCSFTLTLQAGVFANRSWTGDLVVQATPGDVTHVVVHANVTSRLIFDPSTELDAAPTADGETHFLLTNDSAGDIGPITFTLNVAGMPGGAVGTFALSSDPAFGVPSCSDGMTLAAGTSCQWVVTYSNATGAGGNNAFLVFDVPGDLHAQAGFVGVGVPG